MITEDNKTYQQIDLLYELLLEIKNSVRHHPFRLCCEEFKQTKNDADDFLWHIKNGGTEHDDTEVR